MQGCDSRTIALNAIPTFAIIFLLLGALVKAAGQPALRMSAAPSTKLESLRAQLRIVNGRLQSMPPAESYSRYQTSFKRVPPSKPDLLRQLIYLQNLLQTSSANNNTQLWHVAAVNKFSDMRPDEFVKYLGLREASAATFQRLLRAQLQPPSAPEVLELERRGRALLEDLSGVPDWSIILPGVKNQGSCGSCWAFSSVCITEAAHYIDTGQVVSLSEQQLVDCVGSDNGCTGGYMEPALQYILNMGLTTSNAFPYNAMQDICPARLPSITARISEFELLPLDNEVALLAALNDGPVAVAVTTDTGWMQYAGGVYTSRSCLGRTSHSVVVVGAGIDSETNTPYWLIRNSWGPDWGEGGYMRIFRGTFGPGMCNIATFPVRVKGFKQFQGSLPPKSSPSPTWGSCKPQSYTVTGSESLVDVAVKFKASMSQIMLDNNLNWTRLNLVPGMTLVITCPVGTWSRPYGFDRNKASAMSEIPMVGLCPPGRYAVAFYVKPSKWKTGAVSLGSAFVGTITMTCSDGSMFTADAQPNFEPGWASGTTTKTNGFSSIPLRSGVAIDSLFGVGAQSGGEVLFNCPRDTLVTGFSAGAAPFLYPQSYIINLQFVCANPFGGTVAKVRALRLSSFPRSASGLSCPVHFARANDTWFSVAEARKVDVIELLRVNPRITRDLQPNDRVFLPPCKDGVLQGTNVAGG